MKKTIFAALVVCLAMCFSNKLSAKGIPIPFAWPDHKLITAVDLPNDSTTYSESHGAYLNVGYSYKQVWLLWVPLWNYDEQYCLLIEGNDDEYIGLSPEELESVKEELSAMGITLPSNPISFWQKMGGKLIVLALVAFGIWGSIKPKKEEDEATEKQEA